MTITVETSTLGNGLRVVSERVPGLRSSAVGVWFGVGARDERPDQAGASHFLEHLLFKGTQTRTARAVAEAIDGVGGDMNAFTAREYTAFYTRVPAASQAMATSLLFDVIANPALRSSDVDAERLVIGEELVAALDTPDDLVHISLYEALFDGHPLGREVLGAESTIASMNATDIAAFHRRWYRPANMVVAASGAIDHDELMASVDEAFGALEPGEVPKRTAPAALDKATVAGELPVEQLHVALGWRGLPHDHDDRFAFAIANQILGGSPSSRLFQDIREERALAYTVFSSTSSYADSGSATLYAATSAARSTELLGALDEAVRRFVDDGATAREVDLARRGFEGSVLLGLEDSGSRMHRLGSNLLLRDSVGDIDRWLERLRAVTVDEVNEVIRTVWGSVPVRSFVGSGRALYDAVA